MTWTVCDDKSTVKKKINVNVFKEQSGSRSSGTFLCPLAWVPVNYSLVSAVLCVWLETELMHHCWTDSEWKMTHIMPPLKSSFITCNRQTDGWISWRQKSSTLFRVLTSFGVSSSFKTQCFVQMFNSESEIIHKSIHNRFSINTSFLSFQLGLSLRLEKALTHAINVFIAIASFLRYE